MPENLTTEINVATWLRVIAEMARSRMRNAQYVDGEHAVLNVRIAAEALTDAGMFDEHRARLLQLAAEAIRAADEHFPGDGLDLG